MKFIMCQPATRRFRWELEVTLTRMKELGVTDIVLLFARFDDTIPIYLRDKYGVEVYIYDDLRSDKSYIPSVKPYLWSMFLKEDPTREHDTYFYLDADVILRDIPAVGQNGDIWIGSDCSHYLSLDYIDSKGDSLVEEMCKVIGIDSKVIRDNRPVCGAQWIIPRPTYEYWSKVYEDSTKLYKYLDSLNGNDIQKWTAEMWAQLWNVYHFGKTAEVSKELDFSWATDDIDRYYETKIYHNAGVVDDRGDLFFKGKYVNRTPFEDDLSFVNPNKASIKYVEAIKAVR